MRQPVRGTRDLRRRGPVRAPKARFLILCEGKVTEAQYFGGLQKKFRGTLVVLEVKSPTSEPLALVKEAVERKREAERAARRFSDPYLTFDEVWCVVDVDEHAHLAQASATAAREGIRMAISNPCFELWLLLHFRDHYAHIDRKNLAFELAKHIPHYSKSIDCRQLLERLPAAEARGEQLHRRQTQLNKGNANPSTDVWQLTQSLQESADQGSPARL